MSNLEGVILSDYLLLECISQGGVADVYRARQNVAGRYEVAVKVFRPSYAEQESFRTYFMYEAEKIGQFDHPHILPFIEYGEGEGLLYSVTPFMKGGTLANLCGKVGGKFSAMQALPIVQQLCAAVDYAHRRDVTHGNIKPGNIFVANDGRMLLADFGIARGYAAGQLPFTDIQWDSTEYAAPEQSLGLLRQSSDIYSLGALAFRLLTGLPVFQGQTPIEVLLKHVREEPPSIRTLNANISAAVDEVLHKALSKRSDDRYRSASELSQAFAAAVAIAPVASLVARPVNLATRPLTASLSEGQSFPSFSSVPLVPSPPAVPPFLSGLPASPTLSEQQRNTNQSSQGQNQAFKPDPSGYTRTSIPLSVGSGQPLPFAQDSVVGDQKSASDPLAHQKQPVVNTQTSEFQSDSQRKRSLLLPVLVVILLLLGLLGALLSSLLYPAPAPGSGTRQNLPLYAASQTHLTHLGVNKCMYTILS